PAHAQPLRDAAFRPDGEGVFTCGDEDVFRLWDFRSARLVRAFAGHAGGVRCLAVSRDGALVVSGGLKDGRVRAWDARTGTRRKTSAGHKGELLSVALSRDGKQLFSAGRDGTVRVRDFRTGTEFRRIVFPSVLCCAWSPDSKQALVALPEGIVVLCDL